MTGSIAAYSRKAWRRLTAADGGGFTVVQTILSQILVVALNMATGVITARLLGPEGRGVFAAATVWPQFLSGACFVGIPAAIVYYIRHNQAASGSIFMSGILIAGLLCLVTTAIGLLVAPLTMHDYTPDAIVLAQYCVIATIPYVYMALFRQVLIALGMFSVFNASSVLIPFIYFVALLLCWGTIGVTVVNSASTQIAAVVVIVAWMGWRLWPVAPPSFREGGHWFRTLTLYGIRGAPADCLFTLGGYVDRLVLMSLVSARDLGLYAVAYSLSRLMLVLQTAVSAVVFPKMAGRPAQGAKLLHDHAFRFITYAAIGVILMSLMIGRAVLGLLYGQSFEEAGPVFDILILEAALTCIAQLIAQLFYSLGHPGYTSLVQAGSFLTAGAGLLVLVPREGIIGAAFAMAIAAGVRLTLLLLGLGLRLKMSLPRVWPRRADMIYLRQQFLG
ncbi:MAG TPA: oligosaccharide flippase family protein [Rhodopila sp.]